MDSTMGWTIFGCVVVLAFLIDSVVSQFTPQQRTGVDIETPPIGIYGDERTQLWKAYYDACARTNEQACAPTPVTNNYYGTTEPEPADPEKTQVLPVDSSGRYG